MQEKDRRAEFDRVALPHIDAAYNLARWLTRHDQDAEDIVQEAYLRAFQFFRSFEGDTGRPWMLQIVRNTCYTFLAKERDREPAPATDQTLRAVASIEADPATVLEQGEDVQQLMQAIDGLPVEYREVILLRELEELSYKEIAKIVGIPLGTVMSRLARAREKLHEVLDKIVGEESLGLP